MTLEKFYYTANEKVYCGYQVGGELGRIHWRVRAAAVSNDLVQEVKGKWPSVGAQVMTTHSGELGSDTHIDLHMNIGLDKPGLK